MMKRLSRWLSSSFRQWDFTEKEGSYILWIAFITFLVLFIGRYVFNIVEPVFQIWCLGLTIVPPIVLGVKSIMKKQKFNPLYWFLGIFGLALGGLFSCLVLFVIRGIAVLLSMF